MSDELYNITVPAPQCNTNTLMAPTLLYSLLPYITKLYS